MIYLVTMSIQLAGQGYGWNGNRLGCSVSPCTAQLIPKWRRSDPSPEHCLASSAVKTVETPLHALGDSGHLGLQMIAYNCGWGRTPPTTLHADDSSACNGMKYNVSYT